MAASIKIAGLATILTLAIAGCESHDFVAFKRVSGNSAMWINPLGQDPSIVNDPSQPYNYLYYPSTQVYYNVQDDMFYWQEPAGWKSAYRLPRRFSFIHAPYEDVVLSSNRPYYHHNDVMDMYPPDDYVLIQVSDLAAVVPAAGN